MEYNKCLSEIANLDVRVGNCITQNNTTYKVEIILPALTKSKQPDYEITLLCKNERTKDMETIVYKDGCFVVK